MHKCLLAKKAACILLKGNKIELLHFVERRRSSFLVTNYRSEGIVRLGNKEN